MHAGLFLGGGWKLLGAAIVLILAITAWVLGHMIPFFYVLKAAGLLRVSREEELEGLDTAHGMGTDSTWFTSSGAPVSKVSREVMENKYACQSPSSRLCHTVLLHNVHAPHAWPACQPPSPLPRFCVVVVFNNNGKAVEGRNRLEN